MIDENECTAGVEHGEKDFDSGIFLQNENATLDSGILSSERFSTCDSVGSTTEKVTHTYDFFQAPACDKSDSGSVEQITGETTGAARKATSSVVDISEFASDSSTFDTKEKAEEYVDTGEGAIEQTISESVGSILCQLELLNRKVDEKIMRSEHEAKIIDKMHEELQAYKDDLYSQLTQPILRDIISLRDHICKLTVDTLNKAEETPTIPLDTFSSFADDLKQILEDNNVEIAQSEVGTSFVPIKQKALEKLTTSEASLHKTIAAVISDGYYYKERTLSPQRVIVYSYKPNNVVNSENEGENNG
jgi:molecular chaperone GrpE (heat shock protein)